MKLLHTIVAFMLMIFAALIPFLILFNAPKWVILLLSVPVCTMFVLAILATTGFIGTLRKGEDAQEFNKAKE